ncbi:MAG: AbrB/MazE/SpoVT family DNA-binding domain-containing protein [Verrucomicrobiales bacterium]
MKTKVRKIGNSLGVIIPKEALDALKLKEGSELYLCTKENQCLELATEKSGSEDKTSLVDDIISRYPETLNELAQ